MMTKSFNAREKTLLVVLAVLLLAALYYFAVFQPTQNTISAAQLELDELETLLIEEEADAAQLQKMQEALLEISGTPVAETITPSYDNFQNLLAQLNSALSGANDYKLNFQDPEITGGIAKRSLQLVFYASDYAAARRILNELYSSPYRCDITAVTVSPAESGVADMQSVPVSATVSIVYYELYNNK